MTKKKTKKSVKKLTVKPTTYTVYDGKSGKTFATLDEAKAYEADYRKKTGNFVSIEKTTKKPTYKFVNFKAKIK
jgi:hypothetical protein